MSSNHRPVRKRTVRTARPAAVPAATPGTLATSEPIAQASSAPAATGPAPAETPGCCQITAQQALDRHVTSLSILLDRANRVAAALLDKMLGRIDAGEEVYPREFTHVVRALHWLSKCGHELSRLAQAAAKDGEAQRRTAFQNEIAAFEKLALLLPRE